MTFPVESMLRQFAATLARVWFVLAILLLTGAAPSHAQQPGATASPGKLVVGTLRVPPFVLRGDDGTWSGLSIELWNQIAAELKLDFQYREFDYDAAGLLDALEQGKINVAVAAIPVTLEGEARFDFSHPYFTAGVGIAVRAEQQPGMLATLGGLVTYRALGTIGALLTLLLVVGTLIWLLERGPRSHFDPSPVQGISDGIWWAAVTMTTTGYGDKVPVSWRGRSLALIWMFASIFCIALFSATLASSFVVGQLRPSITGPGDLPRARLAAVAGTAGEQWVGGQGLSARTYPFVIQASKALQRGDVQALIFEKAIIGYMIKEYGWRELLVLPHTLTVSDYAIALPTDSPLKEQVNRALLKVIHGPRWKDVVQRYFGSSDQSVTERQ
jgi:polar amino acid transport system substrate-binding protein